MPSDSAGPSVFAPGHGPLSSPDERIAAAVAAWVALAVFAAVYYAAEALIEVDR